MTHKPEVHKRKSIRLRDYDYSQEGLYFITICSYNKENIFGSIVVPYVGARCTCPDSIKDDNAEMILNEYGKIVEKEILNTNKIRENIKINEYAIMPNHIHFILEIVYNNKGYQPGHVQHAPTIETFGKPTRNSVPTIVRLLKASITKQINFLRSVNTPVWQRSYYENII